MLTINGNGRLTRDPELRGTPSGKTVLNLAIATDRRRTTSGEKPAPLYLDLVLWEGAAQAAAKHLTKGQAIAFSGRPEHRAYLNNAGEARSALEVHHVDIEYGPKPHGTPGEPADQAPATDTDDIPF